MKTNAAAPKLGTAPPQSTFPTQVPDLTFLTISSRPSEPLYSGLSASLPNILARGRAHSDSLGMLTFPSQVPAISLFNPFYPCSLNRSHSFHAKTPVIPLIPLNSTYAVPPKETSTFPSQVPDFFVLLRRSPRLACSLRHLCLVCCHVSSHKLQKDRASRLKGLVPFGMLDRKPRHFRDMASIVWRNRDNLGYAWKVLSRGVCDGCALGVAGFHDWTIKGTHLCMTRLNLLRLNTMPALDVGLLNDISKLERLSNAELRELGRIPYPMLRERTANSFRRISWDEAYDRIARRIRASTPREFAFFLTSRGVT